MQMMRNPLPTVFGGHDQRSRPAGEPMVDSPQHTYDVVVPASGDGQGAVVCVRLRLACALEQQARLGIGPIGQPEIEW